MPVQGGVRPDGALRVIGAGGSRKRHGGVRVERHDATRRRLRGEHNVHRAQPRVHLVHGGGDVGEPALRSIHHARDEGAHCHCGGHPDPQPAEPRNHVRRSDGGRRAARRAADHPPPERDNGLRADLLAAAHRRGTRGADVRQRHDGRVLVRAADARGTRRPHRGSTGGGGDREGELDRDQHREPSRRGGGVRSGELKPRELPGGGRPRVRRHHRRERERPAGDPAALRPVLALCLLHAHRHRQPGARAHNAAPPNGRAVGV
mmetsp:Transcript_42574/g.101309  ORF Transcript_42574/g.101309 Transcript_42574/m.101309 type:complete len:262 (+) Transcript_42574:4038-4823(+)